jgi:NitT/TauT family transport system substrate-binding protein
VRTEPLNPDFAVGGYCTIWVKGGTVKDLTIGYLSTMYHTSHSIKAERWIEDEMTMTPAWKLFPTGPAMLEAFATGTIDIGYIGLPPAMIGIAKGVPIICIAGGHVEGTVMIAADSFQSYDELKSIEQVLKQFRGRKLGTPTRGSIHDVIIRNLIEAKAEEIEITNFSWADLIPEALENGTLAGAVGTPPLAVLTKKECATKIVIPPSKLWTCNPSYGIVVRKELFRNKDILEHFLLLHERASNLIREQPLTAAAIVAREIKVVDSAFIMDVFSISPKYCASLPASYRESTMAFVPVLTRLGYITKPLTADDVFDLSIVTAVHPGQEHYSHPGRLAP